MRTEDGALVVAAPSERSSELSAALAQEGVHVREMSSAKLSLEQYFLEVTGDDSGAEEEKA